MYRRSVGGQDDGYKHSSSGNYTKLVSKLSKCADFGIKIAINSENSCNFAA